MLILWMNYGIIMGGRRWVQTFINIIEPSMISPLDPRTRQFYMEMGYTEQQVLRAHEYSIRKKIDILDALAMQTQSAPAPPQPSQKQQQPSQSSSSLASPSGGSFLAPMSQVRAGEYQVLYSRSSRFSALSLRFEVRQPSTPVGLLNISNCCYLNSLLQCYFLMTQFKQILLAAEPLPDIEEVLAENKTKLKRVRGEYELLAKLKKFFTTMALTSKKYLDPTDVLQNLVDSVGEKLTYGQEKDLSEINIMVIERLSEGLTFSKRFFKREESYPVEGSFIDEGEGRKYNSIFNPETGVIKQLFYGTKVEYYSQKQLQKQEPIVSDFTGIILNPRFGTLQSALDEQFNFSVQIKGETFGKQMFIREEPQYLFLYINRTEYDREQQQMHKNNQKFGFDFVLYLDRYMEKYRRERGEKDGRIRKLIDMRNKVKEQLGSLRILAKKMEQCHEYARELQGWAQKLPGEEEFEAEEKRLGERLAVVQRQLQEVESRKEEYHLMYIFVHRGDAVSGHYWGYGRNGANWYRFDINCRPIPQDQILLDMEKSSGTPYALLYVKKDNLPQFKYNYHLKPNIRQSEAQYCKLFDQKLAEEIVRDNILLHQEVQMKNFEMVKKKCFADYVARFNTLKKIVKRMEKPRGEMTRLDSLPLCNNFTLFLRSKEELELFKFSIFEQSLLAASNNKITVDRLMQEGDLLAMIQKKFKMKCKGELHLKNYAMVGKDLERYLNLQAQYQISVFEVVWGVTIVTAFEKLHPYLQKLNLKGDFLYIEIDGALAGALSEVVGCLRLRGAFIRSEQYIKLREQLSESLYVGQINNELSKLIMLRLVTVGFQFESLGKIVDLSDAAGLQIAAINSQNTISTASLPKKQFGGNVVGQVQEMIKKFFAFSVSTNRKNSAIVDSASKLERRSSSKANNNHSDSASPFKSASSLREKRPSDSKLTSFAKSQIVFLDTRETWKVEQIQSARPNFDFPLKVLSSLKKLSPIIRLYKRTLQLSRALSKQEIVQLGIVLNQARVQLQSLI